MPPALLDSQLAKLEPLDADETGFVLDVARPPGPTAATAAHRLGAGPGAAAGG